MRRFECSIEETAGVTVVRPSGEIDLVTVTEFRLALDSALQATRHIVLDMSDLGYIDSTGFKALLVCHQQCFNQGRALTVAALPRQFAGCSTS